MKYDTRISRLADRLAAIVREHVDPAEPRPPETPLERLADAVIVAAAQALVAEASRTTEAWRRARTVRAALRPSCGT